TIRFTAGPERVRRWHQPRAVHGAAFDAHREPTRSGGCDARSGARRGCVGGGNRATRASDQARVCVLVALPIQPGPDAFDAQAEAARRRIPGQRARSARADRLSAARGGRVAQVLGVGAEVGWVSARYWQTPATQLLLLQDRLLPPE